MTRQEALERIGEASPMFQYPLFRSVFDKQEMLQSFSQKGIIECRMPLYKDDVDPGAAGSWVYALRDSSLSSSFNRLSQEVQADVAVRNSLLGTDQKYKFEFTDRADHFDVTLKVSGLAHEMVLFRMAGDHIDVQDGVTGSSILGRVIPVLNEEGDWRLKIGEFEYLFWQVRRKALEELFHKAPMI